MKETLASAVWKGGKTPEKLFDMLRSGFSIENECVFLASLATKRRNVSGDNFPDKTGWECFVNSIHIDDYCTSAYVLNSIIFLDDLFKKWRERKEGVLQAIVSSDEFGAIVKFHLLRDGESWVDQNLEKYEDPILVVDSTIGKKVSDYIFHT
ncbi:hypothetical protein [Achromobacter xylosoxidans]|uniref:hypothetical protein n=1 Tax=Alcaligenes xylosoxydans xylosoxydans TaxID=85698 RepID=UPI001177DCEF|nr:hypothetical protein [Achromobacter xylosoxidans]